MSAGSALALSDNSHGFVLLVRDVEGCLALEVCGDGDSEALGGRKISADVKGGRDTSNAFKVDGATDDVALDVVNQYNSSTVAVRT